MGAVKCLGCGSQLPEKSSRVALRMGERFGTGYVAFCSKNCNARFVLQQQQRNIEERAQKLLRHLSGEE